MTLQPVGQGQEDEGGVEAVALAPEGAVEQNGGEEQKAGEGEGRGGLAFGKGPAGQPETGVGQEDIKDDGEDLDEVEVGHPQIGKGRQEIEVGDVIVPHLFSYGEKAAVFPEKLGPGGEEVVIVAGGVFQRDHPDEDRRPQGEEAAEEGPPGEIGVDQQGEGQKADGEKEEKEGQLGGGGALLEPEALQQTGDEKDGAAARPYEVKEPVPARKLVHYAASSVRV